MVNVIEYILHVDKHLDWLIMASGSWSYIILFAVIFAETGLVILPFLPGDSLLFAAGAIAARGTLDIVILLCALTLAAILGDTLNYWIGHAIGPKVFHHDSGWLRKEHLIKTRAFFEKYGPKAVVLGRFIPIIRTFAPFVAGIGAMSYKTFLFYNIVGGIAWVGGFTMLGYLFGNIPVVKENFTIVVLVIIFLSLLPLAWELMMHHKHKRIAPQ